jgi:multidrug resistance efflux pump
MLNISKNSIRHRVNQEDFRSFKEVEAPRRMYKRTHILLILLGFFLILTLLPWTQNIRARGYVTTLRPDQRPQSIHSVIAGRVEKWHVQEGDRVQKGDTLLFISEIKDDYFDPNLIERTDEQIQAKNMSMQSYEEKVSAMRRQVEALRKIRTLKQEQNRNKIQQAKLKIRSDSIDYEAAIINLQIAENQFARYEELYEQGLKSLTDYEARKLKLQEAQAKAISAENKLLTTRNELINAELDLVNVDNEFQDKIAKAQSELYASLSSQFGTEAEISKLENQLSNYNIRNELYYVRAPQDGYITKARTTGLGEVIKEGTEIVSIMPANYQLAVEMYVKPLDLPLISTGSEVRFVFDGWPFIVFSGWPSLSVGTYGGVVVAIDNFASDNGKYRMLVAPDPDDEPWPEALRVGSGASGFALLKEVPIWYEIWRNINGFPPDYYENTAQNQTVSDEK